ncbi:hypothetical protein [Proteiniphilum sp. UBA5510]|uniref:hypothetical protein n=1 Tax=Proteiniphilum sp. UBA5510 TaxID=1947286 RepID=UPI00257A03B4|nr:hypothetical protein [Proteiniphilum sp. UBA5510]
MKRFFLIEIFLLFFLNVLFAQVSPLYNTVIPPSPSSATYRQYGNYAPSLATGSINIPISLYNIEFGGYSLPLSLVYNTSGIKVEEDPYPCGYGWKFFPGLRIMRTILGRPDLNGINYKMDMSNFNEEAPYDYYKKLVYSSKAGDFPDIPLKDYIDSQHDIFTIHLPNLQITFFIVNNKVRTVGTNVKIIPKLDGGELIGFKVIDDKGIEYFFENYLEKTENNITTAWMLDRIVLPGNKIISFKWDYFKHSKTQNYVTVSDELRDCFPYDYNRFDDNDSYISASELGYATEQGNYDKMCHLSKITYSGTSINFKYKDIDDPFLTNLSVINQNGDIVKNIDFNYGVEVQEDLLLQSLSFSDEGKYTFIYNPIRFSNYYSQDFWGYYNGKPNHSLVPLLKLKTKPNRESAYLQTKVVGNADRSINCEAMKANILEKIIYPTGGYSIFSYEAHQFNGKTPTATWLDSSYRVALNQGGGLRVTKINSTADSNSAPVVKYYKYGINENGKAVSIAEPTYDTFVEDYKGGMYHDFSSDHESGSLFKFLTFRILYLNGRSNYSKMNFNAVPIWYEEVTEYTEDEGKTVFSFRKVAEDNVFTNIEGYGTGLPHWSSSSDGLKSDEEITFNRKTIQRYNNIFTHGPLNTQIKVYKLDKGSYILLREKKYNYKLENIQPDNLIKGLLVERNTLNFMGNNPDFKYLEDGSIHWEQGLHFQRSYYNDFYSAHFYDILEIKEVLDSEETISYTPNGVVNQKVEYTYKNDLIKTKTITNSEGSKMTETYLYPYDYGLVDDINQSNILRGMVNKNIVVVPVSVTSCINTSEITKEIWYKSVANTYLPSQEFYQKDNNPKECRFIYEYDKKGNIRSISKDGIKTYYIWGYNYQYTVAKIENASYSEIINNLGTDIDLFSAAVVPDFSKLNGLRQKLKKAFITTYGYTPLIGIIFSTEPNGKTTYYEYDPVGRLQYILNTDIEVLKKFDYHIINSN